MFSKFTLTAAAAAVALTAMPAAADARHRDGYRSHDRYQQSYGHQRYRRGDNYYGGNQGYYGRSYGNNYYGDRYYNGRRCSGTTGTVVGGVAGALLGREVSRGGSRYRRGGNGTTGAIIGGAIGALAGRAVDKSSCRNRY
jgi:glycine zipper 2TM protein